MKNVHYKSMAEINFNIHANYIQGFKLNSIKIKLIIINFRTKGSFYIEFKQHNVNLVK